MRHMSWWMWAALAVAVFVCATPPTIAATRTFDFEGSSYGVPDDACPPTGAQGPPLFNRPGYGVQTQTYIVAPAACGEGQLAGTFGNDSLLTGNIGGSTTNELRWSWVDPTVTDAWARVNTFSGGSPAVVPKYPSPTIDLRPGCSVKMKIWVYTLDASQSENTSGQLEFALCVRETGQNLPLGDNGGYLVGTVEFVGVTTVTATFQPKGGVALNHDAVNYYTVQWTFKADNTKVDVSVNGGTPVEKSILGFSGDGVLSAPYNRGTIDGLAIMKPDSDTVSKKFFVNIDDIVIDAPGITDPVKVASPIRQTDDAATVQNININASAVKLYANASLLATQTFTPGAAPSQYTFTGISLNVDDLVTATQVVDGVESDPSAPVKVTARTAVSDLTLAIGVREQAGLSGPIGATVTAAASGSLEWIGLQTRLYPTYPLAKPVVAGGGWQELTFDATTDLVGRCLGVGNDVLNGPSAPWYVLEHLAIGINRANPIEGPYVMYVDHLENVTTVFEDFEAAAVGTNQFMFCAPRASGSTSGFLAETPNVSQISDNEAYGGSGRSVKLEFKFIDTSTSNWIRLTTNNFADDAVALHRSPQLNIGVDGAYNPTKVRVKLCGAPDVAIAGPIKAGDTTVTIKNVSTIADRTADGVKVFAADGSLLGQAPGNGTDTVVVPVPALAKDDKLTAKQMVGRLDSCASEHATAGSGTNNAGIRLALGIRENTALTGPVGGNGGKTGTSIEWLGVSTKVNGAPQGKLITPSADWQTVTFDPATDPVLSFSGGNGVLNGTYGVLEHLAITTTGTDTGNYVLYVDNIENDGVTFGTFDSYAVGDQVMFQEPTFSGSTSAYLLVAPSVSAVDDMQFDGSSGKSLRLEWQFLDNDGGRWARVTTSDDAPLAGLPNPMVNLTKPITLRVLLLPTEVSSCNTPPADLNGDGFVDGNDFGIFGGCFNGSGNPITCGEPCADLDNDGDVDGSDFGIFGGCFNGTGNPPNC